MTDDKIRLLIVEDEPEHVELIRDAFSGHLQKFSLKLVGTIKDAKKALSDSEYNLVISDIILPDGNGTTLIPSKEENSPYPVAVMTAYGDEKISADAIKAGALDYIVKSAATIANLPHAVIHLLREWENIKERLAAEDRFSWESAVNKSIAKLSEALIDPASSIDDIARITLESAMELTSSKHGFVSSIDPVTGDMVGHTLTEMMGDACRVEGEDKRIVFPIGEDGTYPKLWGHTLNTREGFFTNTPPDHSVSGGLPEGHLPLENFLATPTVIGDDLLGMIALANSGNGFSDQSLTAIKQIANLYALAIQRVRSDEVLEERMQIFNAILSSAPICIGRINENGVITESVGSGLKKFGLKDNDLVGLNAIEASGEHIRDHLKRALNGETVEFIDEGKHDGVPYAFHNVYFPDKVAGKGIFNVAFDITEGQQAEKERQKLSKRLQRAERMESLGLLAGGVAHDLNNIIGPIMAYPDMILAELPEDTPLREDLLDIKNSARKASAVIDDLLSLARRGKYEMMPLKLNWVVNSYVNSPGFKKLHIQQEEIIIDVDLADDLLNISGSEPHLHKAIMNLVINAFESMEHGGRLSVKTYNQYVDKQKLAYDEIGEGEYAVVEIEDQGYGIEKENIEKIFDPFFTTKRKAGSRGTGLGLFVVIGIVKDHGGYIDIQSHRGEGTTIWLYFPVTREKFEHEPINTEDYSGNESILVVDDIIEQRKIAIKLLSPLGYEVRTAANGHIAIEMIKKKAVDLVLLDMIMEEDFDGLDTYREILKINPNQKAIIASGFTETERVKEARKLGAGPYVKKPYTIRKIGTVIRQELDRK